MVFAGGEGQPVGYMHARHQQGQVPHSQAVGNTPSAQHLQLAAASKHELRLTHEQVLF